MIAYPCLWLKLVSVSKISPWGLWFNKLLNPVAPGRCVSKFKSVIFKLVSKVFLQFFCGVGWGWWGWGGVVGGNTSFKGNRQLAIPASMHHGRCVTHLPWCMSGSQTRGGGEKVPGIPGACATRKFTYLARGPWSNFMSSLFLLRTVGGAYVVCVIVLH